MKFSIYDNGKMKPELKVGMVIDDYKLKNKDDWWAKSLKKTPEIEKYYELVKEEIGAGITKDTTNCYRYYRLKPGPTDSGKEPKNE